MSAFFVAPARPARHAPRAMKKTLASALTALTLSLLAACGGGAASAAGHYEIDKAAFKEAMLATMPAEAKNEKMALQMVEQMAAGMNVAVDLAADGTATMSFKMDVMGQKKEDTEHGTWKLEGNKLTMTTKDDAGKEETKTADYANGSFSIEHEDDGRKMKMTFKKK